MSAFDEVLLRLQNEQKVWLVTGCAGFIGSNLVEFLLKHNQKVVGLDNLSTGYVKNIEEFIEDKNFRFIKGDITNRDLVFDVCKDIDIILHQASLGSVPRSIKNPLNTNNSNITGFITLLDVAKDRGIKKFVYASSSSVYGDNKDLPKVEEITGNPLSPYAVTKATNELYAKVFYNIYNIPTIGLRYFNVFGKRQNPNGEYSAVIPKWIDSMLDDREIYINGDGSTSRDFSYIDNIIQMNILAGLSENQDAFGDVFNVAFGGQSSLIELYNTISTTIKKLLPNIKISQPIYRDYRQGDIKDSNANIKKAQKIFGYEPRYDINSGIDLTVKWYFDDKCN